MARASVVGGTRRTGGFATDDRRRSDEHDEVTYADAKAIRMSPRSGPRRRGQIDSTEPGGEAAWIRRLAVVACNRTHFE